MFLNMSSKDNNDKAKAQNAASIDRRNFLKKAAAYHTPWAVDFMSFWGNRDAAGKPANTGDGQRMGLYAAGNTMGGRFLLDYPVVVAGISHGFALTHGRLAGITVAGL